MACLAPSPIVAYMLPQPSRSIAGLNEAQSPPSPTPTMLRWHQYPHIWSSGPAPPAAHPRMAPPLASPSCEPNSSPRSPQILPAFSPGQAAVAGKGAGNFLEVGGQDPTADSGGHNLKVCPPRQPPLSLSFRSLQFPAVLLPCPQGHPSPAPAAATEGPSRTSKLWQKWGAHDPT